LQGYIFVLNSKWVSEIELKIIEFKLDNECKIRKINKIIPKFVKCLPKVEIKFQE